MGRTGTGALREMGAALQMIRMGTGNSEQAATAFEATLRTLGDRTKVLKLQSGGIQVFDPVELKKGKEVIRPINELMADIIKKTGGKKTLLSQVFDAEAMRAFNAATSEFQRTGRLDTLNKFMKVQADGTATLRDSARAAADAAGSIQQLSTNWTRLSEKIMGTPISRLNARISALNETEGFGGFMSELFYGDGAKAKRTSRPPIRQRSLGSARENLHAPLMMKSAANTPAQQPVDVGGVLKIEIAGAPARVREMRTSGPMIYSVDTGPMPVGS